MTTTYLDIYAAVKRGVRYTPDLAIELYQPDEAIALAVEALRSAGVFQFVQRGGGTRIEIAPDAVEEAGALRKAKAAGVDLNATIAGARVPSMYPGRW